MKSLIFNVICCSSLCSSTTVSESTVSKDGKGMVFVDQHVYVNLNPKVPKDVHRNKGAVRQVYLNKGAAGREYLNKGSSELVHPKKASPGRVYTNTTKESDQGKNFKGRFRDDNENTGGSESSSRGRSICKCGVGKRLGVKKIREGKQLWRNRMIKRCPLSRSLPKCFFRDFLLKMLTHRWMVEHSPVAAAGKHQALAEELEEDVGADLAEIEMEEELEDGDYSVGEKVDGNWTNSSRGFIQESNKNFTQRRIFKPQKITKNQNHTGHLFEEVGKSEEDRIVNGYEAGGDLICLIQI